MAASVIVDAGFLIALLIRADSNHRWAVDHAQLYQPTWQTCEAALSEAYHLVGYSKATALNTLIRRQALAIPFHFSEHAESVLNLMDKYSGVPISLADACLVRMTEILPEPVLLTTDSDFRIYRRHSRQSIPCVLPG